MKKALFFALVLAVFCGMASCKKPSTPNSIVFGNTEDMIVKTYDSCLVYNYHSETSYYYEEYTCRCIIDINNDGTEDIGIVSTIGTNLDSPNLELISVTRLELDQNTCVSCENVFHGDYFHLDSTFTSVGDTILYYYSQCCEKESDDDVFDELSSFMNDVIPFYKGDLLSKNDYFYWPNTNLHTQPHYYYPSCFHDQDLNVVQEIYLNKQFDCYNFPLDKETYIGVKTTNKDGTERLGWIKIYLESQPNGTHKLTQLETAIQK